MQLSFKFYRRESKQQICLYYLLYFLLLYLIVYYISILLLRVDPGYLLVSFDFSLKDALQQVLLERFAKDEFPLTVFILECYHFSLNFLRRVQPNIEFLVFSFQNSIDISLLSPGLLVFNEEWNQFDHDLCISLRLFHVEFLKKSSCKNMDIGIH